MDEDEARKDAILLTIYKWGAMLLIFMATVMLNIQGETGSWTKYLYMFAFFSWLVLVVSSLVRDRMAEENTDKKESVTDFIPNAVTTTLYFGFVVNAIAKKMNITGAYAGGNKRGGGLAGEPEYGLAKKLGTGFSTTIYMAIFMVLINVFSNLYIFHHCEEKDENTMINSLVGAQYNIIIISFLGVITFLVSNNKKNKSENSA